MDSLTSCLKELFVNEKSIFLKFTDKINQRKLINNPNFKRCPECHKGFVGDSHQKQNCTECQKMFCSDCNGDWIDEREHNNRTCLGFAMYQKTQKNSSSKTDIQKYLLECKDVGEMVKCPKCKIICMLG